ncbi:RusA family crossover junction endodeoxyribonuclease (plasmid) [Paenibacillus urinalis]|uniref:RusA family crossover junction endodeoxyribonuclease n=1 Tax=Paenibacillus urinalis TaxID=521520 RepID=A0ABY7XHH1_9BACL|nr:RusA family crossover junction endodeoxyribonuclease [Paenibacillus urinalis]WDI05053.1 RusA family crossover junction endodeoxyribonuclease [Paenibacillus urinalis]
METLILPMMMFGSYKSYEKEKDPVTGRWKIKKELNGKGKLKPVKKVYTHVEALGDPGFYPSVNHIYENTGRGGKKLTKPAEDLFEKWHALAYAWSLKNDWKMTTKDKVVLELTAYFPDEKKRDTHNVFKLMMDALEGVIYKNDHYALPRVKDFHYLEKDSGIQPYFELRIFRKADEIDLEDVRKEYEEATRSAS